jgi:hypothetical protein
VYHSTENWPESDWSKHIDLIIILL